MAPAPRIVAFLCNWCAYSAADKAAQARLPLPDGLLAIRVMCTGRVEPAFVLQAFREGADGVLVAGCHPGDCHYVDGNLKAAARMALLERALDQAGIERARLRLAWASATEGVRLVAVAREMSEALAALGPLDLSRRALPAAPEPVLGPLPPRAPGRPRVAFYWNASCGGCEEAIVDLGGAFADLARRVEIVLWPVAVDVRRHDVERMAEGAIDVAFVNGAVRLADQDEWARLLRRKARRLVAFGACAHLGGVVGLGNLAGRGEILETAYRRVPSVSNPGDPMPGGRVRADGHDLSLPVLLDRALPLDEAVPVDFTIPGCPPSPAVIAAALERLLGDDPPPRGAVLAPNVSLCDACPRRDSKPERIALDALRRFDTAPIDERCFLAQGLVCLGPGTRQGCQPGCVEVGMPCRGCFGPLDGIRDGGAAMLSAFASLLSGGEEEVRALAARIADPAGTFWRYSSAAGLLPARVRGEEEPR
jgi:F420-non-reducing hydrogenase small subunit